MAAELQKHGENFIVMEDFNGHVGSSINGYEGVHAGFGWGERNKEVENVLEFADSCGMIVGNTYFQKDIEKLIKYKSIGNSTVLDYTLFKKEISHQIKDIKVIPGDECFVQHRLLVVDWSLKEKKQLTEAKISKRVKLW